jgi:hypothetical protein
MIWKNCWWTNEYGSLKKQAKSYEHTHELINRVDFLKIGLMKVNPIAQIIAWFLFAFQVLLCLIYH